MYYNSINESQVINTWGQHIKESLGIENPEKLSWMSKYAYYHDLHDKMTVNESVDGHVHLNPNMNIGGMGAIKFPSIDTNNTYDPSLAGSGDNVYSVLPLALQVAAQTIALDLVNVVPMQGPHGMLQYMDYVYEGGRLNNAGGSAYTTPENKNFASPYMIKAMISDVTVGGKKYTFIPNGKYMFKGEDGFIADYELTYIYPARIDGKPIFRVIEKSHYGDIMIGGENAATPIYEIFEGLADGTYTMWYLGDGNETGGTGSAADVELTIGKSDKPELVKAFEDHVTSFSGEGFLTDNVTSNNPYSREMGEATPSRNIGLTTYTLDVKAQTYKVKSAITREQVQDLKQFGIDAMAQVEAGLVNELTQCINKLILDKMFALGAKNAIQIEKVEGMNEISAWFTSNNAATGTQKVWLGMDADGKPVYTEVAPTYVTGGGEVMGTIQRRIMSKLLAASNMISVRGRRGPGTFAVVSGKIGTALQDCAGFVPYPLSNNISQTGASLYPVGSLAGISIYVDPNMAFADSRVLVGRKGKNNEPGVVFCPYLMADKVNTISEFTFAPVVELESRFAVVEAGQHPQTQYYTFGVYLDGVSLI